MKKFSFFEVEKKVVKQLKNAINGELFEGVEILLEVSQENKSQKQKGSKGSRGRREGKSKNRRGGRNRRRR